MFFQQRIYRMTHLSSVEELVDRLTNMSWTLCTLCR